MADRWLRRFTIPELFKYTMIQYPTVVVCSGFYFMGAFFALHAAHIDQRGVDNVDFKKWKYKYIVIRPESPYIKWLHQRDTADEKEEFAQDVAPYPNKWNGFKDAPANFYAGSVLRQW